jgi:hypothetical protein
VVALVHHLEQLGVLVNHSRRSNRRGRRRHALTLVEFVVLTIACASIVLFVVVTCQASISKHCRLVDELWKNAARSNQQRPLFGLPAADSALRCLAEAETTKNRRRQRRLPAHFRRRQAAQLFVSSARAWLALPPLVLRRPSCASASRRE